MQCGEVIRSPGWLQNVSHKPDLGMHPEMLTEAVLRLMEAGVLNGRRKTPLPGKVVTSFCFGNRRFYDYIHDNPAFEFRPTGFTNDRFEIARNIKALKLSEHLESAELPKMIVEGRNPLYPQSAHHHERNGIAEWIQFVCMLT